MATSSNDGMSPVLRCRKCRSWHRLNQELCPMCGLPTAGTSMGLLNRAPVVASVTLGVLALSGWLLALGELPASRMVGLVLLGSWGVALTNLWPEGGFGERQKRERITVSVRTVRRELKEALSRANGLDDPAGVSARIVVLLWRLSLMEQANRAAPWLFPRRLVQGHNPDDVGAYKSALDRLHALEASWMSSRISRSGLGEQVMKDLASLLKTVKAREGDRLDKLRENHIGSPMPGIDVHEPALEIRAEGQALDAKTQQAMQQML